MNKHNTANLKRLKINIWLALAILGCTATAHGACVDNGDGTFTCSGTSDNIDNPTPITGTVILDNASGAAVLNNVTVDPESIGGQTSINNSTSSVDSAATITTNGNNAATVNNLGGNVLMDGSLRVFNAAGWSNDATGHLFNDGVAVGMAAAINATSGLSSLTVNNLYVNDGIFHPSIFSTGIAGFISAYGDYTASVFTNVPTFNLTNEGFMGAVYSFGGATYTPPAVQDGTQYAVVTNAGTTTVTLGGFGAVDSLYVVDRNPLLTLAQAADGSLVLAYGTTDVGPRNSVISVNGDAVLTNLYLGSGAHVVNMGNSLGGGASINNIVVDQSDSDVIDVSGGVATILYKVHGDRTFTYNSTSQYGTSNITLNDVVGAVNVINASGISGYVYGNITANGLGNNTLNLSCASPKSSFNPDRANCSYSNFVSGMTTINLSGESANLYGSYAATTEINLLNTQVYFPGDFGFTLTAPVIRIDAGSTLVAPGSPDRTVNQTMGGITGNLINHGNIYLGDAVLNVSGDVAMNGGSSLGVGVGPNRAGYLNAVGTTSFASDTKVSANIKRNVLVRDGASYVIANNITGMPSMQNGIGLVQWSLSNVAGDLMMTADVGISGLLASMVTPAARNASNAFFSYKGSDTQTVALQTELETLVGADVIRAAERLRPEVNDGAIRMVLGNTDKLFGILDSRMLDSYLIASRNDAGMSGISSGDSMTPGKGIWVQGFGDRGSQKSLDGGDGYGLSSVGMAAGADREMDVDGNLRVGFAFGYGRGNITNAGYTVNNRIDTGSYMAMAYTSRAWDDWYVNGALGFGRHVYDTRRQLLDATAIGHHDSWQLAARMDAGMPISLSDCFTLVPMASLDYSHIKEGGYRENGKTSVYKKLVNSVPQFILEDSPINLQIDSRSFDSYRVGLGGKAVYAVQEPGWAAELELHGMLRHEFGDLAQDSTARFVIGGDSFNSPGIKPVRDTIVLGGVVRITGDDEEDQLTLLTSYDAEIREKYFGQTVSLNLRYDFDQAPRYLKQAAARLAAMPSSQMPGQAVKARGNDIAAISQAMQPVTDGGNDQEARTQAAVNTAIGSWINALSNKNMDLYFNSYATSFIAPDGSTRQQWERKRKAEITREVNAAIKVSYLTVKPDGDRAMAVFNQSSGDETVQKIVDLENRDGRWLIVREDSIALPD